MRVFWLALTSLLLGPSIHAAGAKDPIPGSAIEQRASNIDPLPAYFKTGVLDFESRVWARGQIEKIYDSHRIWPAENRQPKPGFDAVSPPDEIRKLVLRDNAIVSALRRRWGVHVSDRDLQAVPSRRKS